ncbi:hypothetical protein BDV27DRAFT_155541 [Aspergillus caelatus]|uniref:Uncharacterized protein n=1 Tax=Aspergillus caelatus TaxID=61420 RepID=A0A5N7AAQ8_9EURO|nr:uncharacterized protein BDV27DRAFT_155541 [Aspergillus caelatus]KAE8366912.1 hypothetical protein BDV27DRAFT_155541 [Aspergillus caelatus]
MRPCLSFLEAKELPPAVRVDGLAFHLVWGQSPNEAQASQLPQLKSNLPTEEHRIKETQQFGKGPAPLHKLGCSGLCVTDFGAFYKFLAAHFNFRQSDSIYDQSARNITVFGRLDRGSTPVDCH